jgi:hypothetical protein
VSKGWLAVVALASFLVVWYLTRPKTTSTSTATGAPSPTRGPMPTVPNSNGNSAIVGTGKGGLLGTDAETLAVGGGIAVGLSAFGMPLPASVLIARTLAVPTTAVINGAINQTGISFLKNAPPLVKLGTFVGALPVVLSADAVNYVWNLWGGTNGPPIVKVDTDDGTHGLTKQVTNLNGRVPVTTNVPNPNYIKYPVIYPGLMLQDSQIYTDRNGITYTFYAYAEDPNSAAVIGAPPVIYGPLSPVNAPPSLAPKSIVQTVASNGYDSNTGYGR